MQKAGTIGAGLERRDLLLVEIVLLVLHQDADRSIIGNPRPAVTQYVAARKINEGTYPSLAVLVKDVGEQVAKCGSLNKVSDGLENSMTAGGRRARGRASAFGRRACEKRSAHRTVPGLTGAAQCADLMGTSRRLGRPNALDV
jgi:hypothetical protein